MPGSAPPAPVALITTNQRLLRGLMTNTGPFRYVPYPASSLAPTLTNSVPASATATTAINGTSYPWNAPQFPWNGGRISAIGTVLTLDTNTTAIAAAGGSPLGGDATHVQYGSTTAAARTGNQWRFRFMTDAPGFLLHYLQRQGGGAKLTILVDGQIVTPANNYALGYTASYQRNVLQAQFDTIPTTEEIQNGAPGIAAGGTGYVIGDIVTLAGGTGTSATAYVRAVSAGVVTQLSTLARGAYSARPTGTLATTGGTGTGLTVTLPFFRRTRWIRQRTIEVYADAYFELLGVSVGAQYDVSAVPASGPRILFFGDSYTEPQGAEYIGGGWHHQAARRLGLDDAWISGVGGTGFLNVGASRLNFLQRIADIADFAPTDPLTPFIVVVPGSINDNTQGSANVSAQIALFWQTLRTLLPSAIFIQLGVWNSPGSNTVTAYVTAAQTGVTTANAAGANVNYVDTSSWITGVTTSPANEATPITTGNAWWITQASDNTHPEQQGHDYYGFMAAEAVRQVLAAL